MMKTKFLVYLFAAPMLLFPSTTFACNGSRHCQSNCRISCAPVVHVTTVDACCQPVTCGTSVVIENDCCGHQINGCCGSLDGMIIDGGIYHEGGVIESSEDHESGDEYDSPLDPDVLTQQSGEHKQLVGKQNSNTGRIWTDSTGYHKRLATFERIEGTTVILKNADGRTTRIDVKNLSAADQRLLEELQKEPTTEVLPEPRRAERS